MHIRFTRAAKFGVLLGAKSLLCEPLNIQIHTASDSEGMAAVNAARDKEKLIPSICAVRWTAEGQGEET